MRTIFTAASVAALSLAVAGGAEAADKVKACWVYTGPVGDFGYSYQHDQGRLAAAKALGDKVDATTYLENIPDSDSAPTAAAVKSVRMNNSPVYETKFRPLQFGFRRSLPAPDQVSSVSLQRSGMNETPREAGARAPRLSRIERTTNTTIVVR